MLAISGLLGLFRQIDKAVDDRIQALAQALKVATIVLISGHRPILLIIGPSQADGKQLDAHTPGSWNAKATTSLQHGKHPSSKREFSASGCVRVRHSKAAQSVVHVFIVQVLRNVAGETTKLACYPHTKHPTRDESESMFRATD